MTRKSGVMLFLGMAVLRVSAWYVLATRQQYGTHGGVGRHAIVEFRETYCNDGSGLQGVVLLRGGVGSTLTLGSGQVSRDSHNTAVRHGPMGANEVWGANQILNRDGSA